MGAMSQSELVEDVNKSSKKTTTIHYPGARGRPLSQASSCADCWCQSKALSVGVLHLAEISESKVLFEGFFKQIRGKLR